MTSTDPGDAFRSTFSGELLESLLGPFHRGYRTAREHHDPDRGGNENTFGFCLHFYIRHELCSLATSTPDLGIETLFDDQAFRLRVGEYLVAFHRVGDFATEDIRYRFPDNTHSAQRLVYRQAWLPGMEPRVEGARNVVLAHLGNPDTGLEALHICIPVAERNGRISEWGYTHEVWRIDTPAPDHAAHSSEAPEEVVPVPVVRRKPRKGHA